MLAETIWQEPGWLLHDGIGQNLVANPIWLVVFGGIVGWVGAKALAAVHAKLDAHHAALHKRLDAHAVAMSNLNSKLDSHAHSNAQHIKALREHGAKLDALIAAQAKPKRSGREPSE